MKLIIKGSWPLIDDLRRDLRLARDRSLRHGCVAVACMLIAQGMFWKSHQPPNVLLAAWSGCFMVGFTEAFWKWFAARRLARQIAKRIERELEGVPWEQYLEDRASEAARIQKIKQEHYRQSEENE